MTDIPVHTSPDDVSAHPRHTGMRLLDLFLALSAIFISAISLYVAIEHSRIDRELVQANSWPMLQAHSKVADSLMIELSLTDAGVGPAKLENFEVLYKGEAVGSTSDLLHRCCGVPVDYKQDKATYPVPPSTYQIGGDVLRPGDRMTFLEVNAAGMGTRTTQALAGAMRDVSYRACYCSVFDQCWMSTLLGLHPRVVRQCPAGVVNFESQSP